jgi:hypothetical protein
LDLSGTIDSLWDGQSEGCLEGCLSDRVTDEDFVRSFEGMKILRTSADLTIFETEMEQISFLGERRALGFSGDDRPIKKLTSDPVASPREYPSRNQASQRGETRVGPSPLLSGLRRG